MFVSVEYRLVGRVRQNKRVNIYNPRLMVKKRGKSDVEICSPNVYNNLVSLLSMS